MEGVDQSGMQRTSSAFPRPPNRLNVMHINQMGVAENQKISGIPPSHPNTNISPTSPYPQFIASQSQSQSHLGSQRLRSHNLSPGSSHSRSLSQSSFFSLDSLPPLSPSPYREPVTASDVSKEESLATSHAPVPNRGHQVQLGHCLPPRKGHRRSSSDSPLGISGFIQSFPQSVPADNAPSRGENKGFEKPIQLVLKEPIKDTDCVDGFSGEPVDGRKEDALDDLFSAYMSLDNIDNLNFSGMEDSRTSGSKTVESSDNEVESYVNGKTTGAWGASSSCSEERREGVKRSSNGDIAPGARHRRSFSLDSSLENFRVEDGSPNLPPLQNRAGQHSPGDSVDGKTSDISMEFGNGEFSSEEIKKIMENDKLAEIAISDPKRAKRILANRLSAARSKERKMRYISELEHKVQTLQAETTTLSTQYTKLQMDNSELKTENNEYKLRLQALEQHSQLKDALNETLDAEVRRLRCAVAELGGESLLSSRMAQQRAINQQMLQLQHHQQPSQLRHFQLQNSHSQEETQTQSQQIQRNNELQSQRQNGKATAY
ncbi:bZIP transcription factor 29-like [Gastrolobium bilobum]|uniref:bZIP transcription factor 29-like n=1 Tax=Gastrolobium bilobum TaxID=150636 RepID=UPI002AAF8FA9|nr:bZIP transcription factor 29-like [Gastrolobium bilobum]